MTIFKYKSIKKMQPREGVKYSTDYYKQSPHEYTRVDNHIRQVIEKIITTAQEHECLDELEEPLKGFPRTNNRPNYSMMDIMLDMLNQVNYERDIPSGCLGRWNKVFSDNPEFQIEFEEEKLPNPIFNKLFAQQ